MLTGTEKEIKRLKLENIKLFEFYDVLLQWVHILHLYGSFEKCLFAQNINKIVIYGMGELGALLYEELENSDIDICGIYDQDVSRIEKYSRKKMSANQRIEDVDLIIVTAIHAYDEIEPELRTRTSCRIICIDDLLHGIDDKKNNEIM